MQPSAQAPAADAKWRMISQTAEYALQVVLFLADRGTDEPTSAAEAAAALGISERYLARVLNELSHRGVLGSTRGVHGGFRLAVAPPELTLATVVAPFDAVGDPPQCLLRQQRCEQGKPCIAHRHWHEVAGRVRQFFQQTTVADLLATADLPAGAGALLGDFAAAQR